MRMSGIGIEGLFNDQSIIFNAHGQVRNFFKDTTITLILPDHRMIFLPGPDGSILSFADIQYPVKAIFSTFAVGVVDVDDLINPILIQVPFGLRYLFKAGRRAELFPFLSISV